jgi:hypothetical protein
MDNEMTSIDQTNHEATDISLETTTLAQINNETTVMSFESRPIHEKEQETTTTSSAAVVREEPLHRQQRDKCVSFFERVIVRPVLHVDNYTDQEWTNCWYLPSDKERRKDEIRGKIHCIKAGSFDGCSRGLERMSDNGRTKHRRRISIQEVLEEQEAQREEANTNECEHLEYNAQMLRKAYRPHSRAARHVAHVMGKLDEMAVKSKKGRSPRPCAKKCIPKNAIACIHSNDSGATFLQLDFTRN